MVMMGVFKTMETTDGWRKRQQWWWCVVVIVTALFVTPGWSAGAKCRSCRFEDSNVYCRSQGEVYIPIVAVTDTFCRDLRMSSESVDDLCKSYPKGYRVVCELLSQNNEIICTKQLCPLKKPKQSAHSSAGRPLSCPLLLVTVLSTLLVSAVLLRH